MGKKNKRKSGGEKQTKEQTKKPSKELGNSDTPSLENAENEDMKPNPNKFKREDGPSKSGSTENFTKQPPVQRDLSREKSSGEIGTYTTPDSRNRQNTDMSPERNRQKSDRRFPFQRNSFGNSKDSRWDSRGGPSKDPDFIAYERDVVLHSRSINYTKVQEITKDLFEMPEEYSLAHCVAEDMNMGSGIAVPFRQKFKRVDELLNQRPTTGGLAVLKHKNRYIYYLVTKRYSYGKPTYATLFSSLKELRNEVVQNGVRKLAIPRIGCGLDLLEWDNVKFMIEFVFKEVDIEIIVCNLVSNEDSASSPPKVKNCRLTNVLYPIETIEKGTVILYFSSEDEYVSDEMKNLDEKFHFLQEFKNAKKLVGNVIFYTKIEDYLLCGCIVRKRQSDLFDFEALRKCLSAIQKENQRTWLGYYAFQAFRDAADVIINYKIINILRNSLRDVDVYVCWPGDLQNLMSPKDRPNDRRSDQSRRSYNESPDSRNTSQGSNWRLSGGPNGNRYSQGSNPRESFDSYGNTSFNREKTEDVTQQSQKSNWGQSSSFEESFSSFDKMDMSFQEEDQQDFQSKSETSFNDSWDNTAPQPMQTDTPSDDDELASFKSAQKSGKIECHMKEEKLSQLPPQSSLVFYAREDFTSEVGVPAGGSITDAIVTLLGKNQKEGGLTVITRNNNYLYCLILCQASSEPTFKKTFRAIQKLRDHISQNNVKQIVIPPLEGWNCPDLTWTDMKDMFSYLLNPLKVHIIVVSSKPLYSVKSLQEIRNTKLTHLRSGLHQMKKKSVIIYIASVDGYFTEEMEGLAKKFVDFKDSYEKASKNLGGILKHKENEDHVLYGFVVKRNWKEGFKFEVFQKCVIELNKQNKKNEKLQNVGIQAVKDDEGSVSFKLITILLHNLEDVTISVCWPGELRNYMPSTR